ncbi:MAG: hypothetical protein M3Z26_08745 [Bacteroidota bacterium]|nr:hypothetical protein [Bacteroidota bacterium]
MENIYTAYTKTIGGKDFYFVKKYTSFPEYEGSPKVLENLGMHPNFYRACDIAKVYDEEIINKLMSELQIFPETAKAVPLKKVNALTHTLVKSTQQIILKLRLAGINQSI